MITIVALLAIRDSEAFDLFERQAVAIMKTYGGRIDSAFRPEPGQQIDEIHVLKFPDLEAFDSYKNDENLLALTSLREQAILDTKLYISATEVDYSQPQ
jgi:uncharacterized protein (DUF1330 family)